MNASSWKLFMEKAGVYVQQQCLCVLVYKTSIVSSSVCFLLHGEKKNVVVFLNIPHTLFHPCSLGHGRELYLNKRQHENK